MELAITQVKKQSDSFFPESMEKVKSNNHFIEANTKSVTLQHLINDTILPVFSKDNELTISHAEFINSTQEALRNVFPFHQQSIPEIRVSHIIKGRIPSAIGKPKNELLEEDKTLYYERMAFVIELPQIQQKVNGNLLSLVVGGVRAYNQENLYSRKSIEKFQVFIGYKNKVCTNLCVSTDGFKDEIRVSNSIELVEKITELFNSYDQEKHLGNMERMSKYFLTPEQVAHLLGKMKMYQFLSNTRKKEVFPLNINDSQINTIAKSYFKDDNFKVSTDGVVNLWQLYNLITGAVKSSYIDSFLKREACAFEFVQDLSNSMQNEQPNYFLI
jgi:hypothetical protein